MNNWRQRWMEFMQGRYGPDQLNLFLLVVGMLMELVGRFGRLSILYYLGFVMVLLSIFRLFSKNIPARSRENQKFLALKNKIFSRTGGRKSGRKQPVYCYSYCPGCKQQVRVPAGKGKVNVTCPKCKKTFPMHT